MSFTIISTTHDYVVIRVNGEYEQHSHFKRKSGALKLIELIRMGLMPKKPYFIKAAKRLLTEEEFKQLKIKRKKPDYVNVQRGII